MKSIVILFIIVILLTPSKDFSQTAIPLYVNVSLLILSGLVYIAKSKNAAILKKDLIFVWPMLAMSIIISAAHVKGVLLGFQVDLSDLSEYLKFTIPTLLYLIVLAFLRGNNEKELMEALWFCALIYASLFTLYLILGSNFIFNIGLGRGRLAFYRYGGIDMNPNLYAAISVGLFFLLAPNFVERKSIVKLSILALILLSVLFSQSRTTLIFLILSLTTYFLMSKTKIYYKLAIITLGITILTYIFQSYDLYWLTAPDRFNVESDGSFNTRKYNSIVQYNLYKEYVGILGIGPSKAVIDRLDTITYIIYYLRYGIIGLICFVFIHLNFSFQFFINLSKVRSFKSKVAYEYSLIAMIFPIYVLGINISNEKWIDIKFLLIFMTILALASYKSEQLQTNY